MKRSPLCVHLRVSISQVLQRTETYFLPCDLTNTANTLYISQRRLLMNVEVTSTHIRMSSICTLTQSFVF